MPKRTTPTSPGTAQCLTNHSFEMLVATWLMQGGWQVFLPLLDHGHCTDVLASDGPNFYRIQIKTIEAQAEETEVHNKWRHSDVQFVACFAKNSNWGYVMPAFREKRRPLNAAEHRRFQQNRSSFLKAFHSI